jgi:hypothetical protein
VKEEPKVDDTTEAEGGEDEDHGDFFGVFYDRKPWENPMKPYE